MMGDLEKRESMVLTHKNLFNYLESIFDGKSMAPELREQIQEARTFIFLGLPFEKWYMQLLLRMLYSLSKRLGGLEQYASTPMAGEPHTIFKNEFNIQFVYWANARFVEPNGPVINQLVEVALLGLQAEDDFLMDDLKKLLVHLTKYWSGLSQ